MRLVVPAVALAVPGEAFFAQSAAVATARYAGNAYRFEIIDRVGHSVPQLAAREVADLVINHVRSAR